MAADLERDLGDISQVNTFHGYCKHVAHSLGGVGGLTTDFDYFPALPALVIEDLHLLGREGTSKQDLDAALQNMDDDRGLITAAISLGDYYGAVSHADVVYRVQEHLAANPQDVPAHPVLVVDEYQDFSLLDKPPAPPPAPPELSTSHSAVITRSALDGLRRAQRT